MEGLKEFLTPTRFSLFGYMVAIVYFFAGVVFVGITSKLRLNERKTFLCDFSGAQPADKLFLQAQCFDKYEQHYNSPLPLYVFVLLNFATVIVVCLVYSWCCVKSRVDKLQAAVIPDAENPRPRPRVETRCIFFFYFLHLVARLSLGIIFAMLQNFVFYSGGFQVAFVCISGKISAQPHPTLCIQFLNRENNDKNNTFPLGKQICFTIVWGCAETLPHFLPETGIIECHRERFVLKKRTYNILSQLRCV